MIARKLCWLAVEGCLIWLFLRFGSAGALMLAAALVGIPLISIPIHLMIRNRFQVELHAEPNLKKGSVGVVSLNLISPTPFPVAARCRLCVQNLLNGAQQRLDLVFSASTPMQSVSAEVTSAHCGRLCVRIDRIWLYDCFGLIGVPLKQMAQCHVMVLPECFSPRVTLVNALNSAEESDAYSQDRPGRDLTETFQMREYVPGDSPRQIHWKLSGKLDRLIVREASMPVVQSVLLFWERRGKESPEMTDAQVETIVSIAHALLEQSVQFRLGWNDTAENRCIIHEIADLDDLIGVMPRLLSAAEDTRCDSGASLLLQTQPDALCSHMVYLASVPAPEVLDWQHHGYLTVLSGEPTAAEHEINFDSEHYAHQLGVLEL